MEKFVVFLRGINVGGNKKVPMAELSALLEKNNFRNVKTLLNSGNIVFESERSETLKIQPLIEGYFSFSIETLIFPFNFIENLISDEPFKGIEITDKTRLYVSFYYEKFNNTLELPYVSEEQSFFIIKADKNAAYSVLDLEKKGSIDAMKILEKTFGKKITTRNYNTIIKIGAL